MMYLHDVLPNYVMGLHYNNITFIPKEFDKYTGDVLPFEEPSLDELLCMDFTTFDMLKMIVEVFDDMEKNDTKQFANMFFRFNIETAEVEDKESGESKSVKHYICDDADTYNILDMYEDDFNAIRDYVFSEDNQRNAAQAHNTLMIMSEAWRDPSEVEENPAEVEDIFDILLYVDSGHYDEVAYLRR